jgi:hypothetical protein
MAHVAPRIPLRGRPSTTTSAGGASRVGSGERTTGCGARDEDYYDRVRGYRGSAAYEDALGKRKVWVEPLFAEAKRWHGMGRFRLRTLGRVNSEALLVAAGQNLKRLLAVDDGRPKPRTAVAASRRIGPEDREEFDYLPTVDEENYRAVAETTSGADPSLVPYRDTPPLAAGMGLRLASI